MPLLEGSAFVTGAASGIGRATAFALAEHGITKLAVTDVNKGAVDETAAIIRQKWPHVQVLSLRVDVTSLDGVKTALAETVRTFGRLDVAVNNAGNLPALEQTHEMSESSWLSVIDVHLNGVYRCHKEELSILINQEDLGPRRGRGAIVNVVSLYGILGPVSPTHYPQYCAAKHGVMGLTKADANSYAGFGIRINAICPGYTETPLIDWQKASEPGHPLYDHAVRTPLKRLAKPEEVADGVVFLASSMASFVNGTGLVMDGGFSCG